MNEVGFCPVVSGVLSSGVLSCGVLSVWGFVRTPQKYIPHKNGKLLSFSNQSNLNTFGHVMDKIEVNQNL